MKKYIQTKSESIQYLFITFTPLTFMFTSKQLIVFKKQTMKEQTHAARGEMPWGCAKRNLIIKHEKGSSQPEHR
ncbi:hypothetical protein [Phnomibacter sp. MR]|uniref:hypothetical protein n=1 Tax=Phnomibacter sp. MR TaxID=3042318 RepID=UPI003A80F216